MGIAVHSLSAGGNEEEALDLSAAVRQTATGILGTTVQMADLVRLFRVVGFIGWHVDLPLDA